MASNLFSVNVYQINQQPPIALNQVSKKGFPTTGVLVDDVSASPNRSLSTGVSVYTKLTLLNTNLISQQNNVYYCAETYTQMVALINA
jgi:hypothetical protein